MVGTLQILRTLPKALPALALVIGGTAHAQSSKKSELFPIDVEGRAKSMARVEIIPMISGVIVARHVRLGERVKVGDVLIRIDQRRFKIEAERAKIKLKNAEFVLARVNQEIKRVQALVDKKLYPLKSLYDLKIRQDLSVGVVQQAKIELAKTEHDLSRTIIKSPINGFVSRVNVDVGDFVSPELAVVDRERGQVMTLVNYDPVRIVIQMDTRTDIALTKIYMKKKKGTFNFELTLPTGEKYPHRGRFLGSRHRADPKTGMIEHELVFPNPDHLIIPGYAVKVRITEKRPSQ